MRLFKHIFLLVCVALLAACGGSDDGESASGSVESALETLGAPQAEANKAGASARVDPCELLSNEFVRQYFSVAADTVITRRTTEHSPHPLCMLSWRKADADEIEAQRAAAMQEYIMAKSRGEEAKLPMYLTEEQLSLTLYEPLFDNTAAARAGLDQAMSILQKGVSASHQGIEATFQADVVPVEDVGDKAAWAAKLRQLSVISDRRLFHLTVNTGAEKELDLEKAKVIARALEKLL